MKQYLGAPARKFHRHATRKHRREIRKRPALRQRVRCRTSLQQEAISATSSKLLYAFAYRLHGEVIVITTCHDAVGPWSNWRRTTLPLGYTDERSAFAWRMFRAADAHERRNAI